MLNCFNIETFRITSAESITRVETELRVLVVDAQDRIVACFCGVVRRHL